MIRDIFDVDNGSESGATRKNLVEAKQGSVTAFPNALLRSSEAPIDPAQHLPHPFIVCDMFAVISILYPETVTEYFFYFLFIFLNLCSPLCILFWGLFKVKVFVIFSSFSVRMMHATVTIEGKNTGNVCVAWYPYTREENSLDTPNVLWIENMDLDSVTKVCMETFLNER